MNWMPLMAAGLTWLPVALPIIALPKDMMKSMMSITARARKEKARELAAKVPLPAAAPNAARRGIATRTAPSAVMVPMAMMAGTLPKAKAKAQANEKERKMQGQSQRQR